MRCGCAECGAFMVHSEEAAVCVCPECGHRCGACLGTNTVVSRDKLRELLNVGWISRDVENAQASLTRAEGEDDAWT